MDMFPNIKQRKQTNDPNNANRDKPNRKKDAEKFNDTAYAQRGIVECIFGAEESSTTLQNALGRKKKKIWQGEDNHMEHQSSKSIYMYTFKRIQNSVL